MRRLEIRAFTEDDLDGAGAMLAARHRRHRVVEPLLAQRFEEPAAARSEVAALWAEQHASGAVAVSEGGVVGFLLGTRKADQTWGANVWIDAAGYAADEPETIRDLYAFAAQRWADEGRTRHFALVPRLDDQIDSWFRLSFGAQQAHGIRAVDAGTWPPGTRRAVPGDIDGLLELLPLVAEHHLLAPVFSGIRLADSEDDLRAMLVADIEDDAIGELVYERDGCVVASFTLLPADQESLHRGPARPERAACLGFGVSRPDVRGSGVGAAMTQAALAWAHERGYETMVTDWRETNLLSSRFWPARGFRRSFLRLYRSIP